MNNVELDRLCTAFKVLSQMISSLLPQYVNIVLTLPHTNPIVSVSVLMSKSVVTFAA